MLAVWRYFSISETDKKLAICNDCKAQVMRGGEKQHSFNTTNLIVHLKSRHPEQQGEFLKRKEEKAPAPAPAKTSQQPLLQSFNKAKAFNSDHPKVKEINKKIIEFIALDNQPFSVVEDAGFRRLMMHLEPRYAIPSRRFFSDVALPELQRSVSSHVEKLLERAAI